MGDDNFTKDVVDKEKLVSGYKADEEKEMFSLLPPEALMEIGKVYTYGGRKYEPRNMEKGMKWGRVLSAIFRHLFKWMMGERNDKESGLHHMAHAAWGCITLIFYDMNPEHYKVFDDRSPVSHKKQELEEPKEDNNVPF